MLRKILLSTVFAAVAGSALAADLPMRSAPAAYAAMPVFTWTGFYVGLNAGAAFNSNNRGFNYTGFAAPGPTVYRGSNSNDARFTGGAQAGYNMQFGSFVAGVEADINYMQRNRSGTAIVPAGANGAVGTYYTVGNGGSGSNYFGTVRGRLGYAFDRVLIFGTGGLAFGGRGGSSTLAQTNVTSNGAVPPVFTATTTNLVPTNSGNSSDIGYALGGGLEYAFSNSLSFKVEYLHVKLGNNNRSYVAIAPAAGNVISLRNDNKFDIVRAGVNFRF